MTKKILFFIIIIVAYCNNISYSQQLLRQSISSFGSSTITDGVLIRQTVGQSSNTTSCYSDNSGLRQGFQHPVIKSGQNINPEFKIEVSIYPNPISNQFSFIISGDEGKFKYEISDLIGNLIYRNEVSTNEEKSINCSSLPAGIYFISIYSSEKLLAAKKLIKT